MGSTLLVVEVAGKQQVELAELLEQGYDALCVVEEDVSQAATKVNYVKDFFGTCDCACASTWGFGMTFVYARIKSNFNVDNSSSLKSFNFCF